MIIPFGFKHYTKSLSPITKRYGASIHIYVEDSRLYSPYDPPDDVDSAFSIARLEAYIHDIKDWMSRINLKLKSSKIKFLTLGSKLQLSKLGDVSITIGHEAITTSVSAKTIE